MKADTAVAIDALAMGVPCVVCACHAQVTDMKAKPIHLALHLDKIIYRGYQHRSA